jgi:hypothetical protein
MSTDAGASTGATGGASGGAAGAAGAAGATGGDLCEGKDLNCPDDDNPCTEDECNPDTGECGIPRSETICDDGVYCNGKDICDAGECSVHEGNPCSGTCNEAGEYCECSKKADCPEDEVGEWGECAYATTCVETAMRNRTRVTYSCNGVGKCVAAAPVIESEACSRETDGLSCDDGLRCTGTDKCKAGNCDHTGNPCAGGAADADGCWETGTLCRACGAGGGGAACSVKQTCCSGNNDTTASCTSLAGCAIIIGKIGIDPTP